MHKKSFHDPTCADLMTVAERQLAAFMSAVTELFGSELFGFELGRLNG